MASIRPLSPPRPPGPERAATADGLAGRWRTLAAAGLAQLAGLVIAAVTARAASQALDVSVPVPLIAAAAGAAAAACGAAIGLPRWWRAIHLALPLAAWGALALDADPEWFLAAFVACCLLFGAAAGAAVPLYLSSRREVAALSELIPAGVSARVLDAGCGTGTVLAGLRSRCPLARVDGMEISALPWLVARLRAAAGGAASRVAWGSLWDADFGRYDVVYVFLSPAPMARIWRKARGEMRAGSLLVSNRFIVPGVAPTRTVRTGPGERCLHVWRM